MPTTNPRLYVTLPRPIKVRLARLRKLTGTPESRWVSMLLGDCAPMLDALIASLEASKTNPEKAADLMRDAYNDAVRLAATQQAELELTVARKKLR